MQERIAFKWYWSTHTPERDFRAKKMLAPCLPLVHLKVSLKLMRKQVSYYLTIFYLWRVHISGYVEMKNVKVLLANFEFLGLVISGAVVQRLSILHNFTRQSLNLFLLRLQVAGDLRWYKSVTVVGVRNKTDHLLSANHSTKHFIIIITIAVTV